MSADGLHVGRATLHALRQSLLSHAPDRAIAVLQEAGYASGEAVFAAFADWLRTSQGLTSPEELDAALLNDALAEFFGQAGWGSLSVSPCGTGALALDSPDWAEAEPGSADAPMCFFSAGLLADFFGRLTGESVAVMEVECRSRNDGRCRFLSATPETLERVYEAMTAGQTYQEALGGP
jgi:predicted hydrocarbon binding protein